MECFEPRGKQEQEKSELTQLVLQLITRIFQKRQCWLVEKYCISHFTTKWEVEETAVVLG